MKFCVLLICGAGLPYLFDSTLPSQAALFLLLLSLLIALIPESRTTGRLLLLAVAMFVFTSLSIERRINQRLPAVMDKSTFALSGQIVGFPELGSDQLRFVFLIDAGQEVLSGRLIRVSWHIRNAPGSVLPELHAGERWRLPLQVRTTRAQVNFVGPDAERWAFAQGIAARAYVQSRGAQFLRPPSNFNLDSWRESVLEKMKSTAGDVPAIRLLIALAVADRRSISITDRQVLSATGTGHLLAISGLHIGLAAVLGFYFGRVVLLLMYRSTSQKLAIALPWALSWLAALAYAGLAGFGISTQRALIMLSVATLVVLSRRKVNPFMAWLIAMALVLLIDPFAPLRAGFWFSFTAVGILLIQFSPRFGALPGWQKILKAQIAISLIMAPLGMYWFQQASLPGFLANLLAIPLVSFVTVPLILLGLILMWLPMSLASYPFYVAGLSAQLLFKYLQQLAEWQPELLASTAAPSLALVLLAMLGAAVLVMPRGLPGRAVGLMLMLPLMLPPSGPVAGDSMQVDMLDVGQGMAVLVGSDGFLMLYDTGPGNGLGGVQGWDTVRGTIQPAIAERGIAPDLIIASHADLDHAGGLATLQTIWPKVTYLANLPQSRPGVRACKSGMTWVEGDIRVQALHPAVGLPYLGNDSSCVISMKGPEFSLLLTGDISKAVEHRLVMQGVSNHDLMTVAHHGSASSSSTRFIQALQPTWALVSAEANNRFGFPRTQVIKRFAAASTHLLNTADCGGLRLTSSSVGDIDVESARKQRDAIWRFKARGFCP